MFAMHPKLMLFVSTLLLLAPLAVLAHTPHKATPDNPASVCMLPPPKALTKPPRCVVIGDEDLIYTPDIPLPIKALKEGA